MKLQTLRLVQQSLDEIERIARLHTIIAKNGAELTLRPTDSAEIVSDALYDSACRAAEQVILQGLEREFDAQATALRDAGIEDVPTLGAVVPSVKG